MRPRDPRLEPEWRSFLSGRRVSRRAPSDMRARLLARGRALVDALPADSAASPAGTAPPAPRRNRALAVIAVAASVAVVAAAGAVGAVIAGRHPLPAAAPVAQPPPPAPAPILEIPARAVPAPRPPVATPAARRARAVQPGPDLFTAELELLQRAHASYTRRSFPAALALIAEHARRFPRGRLAEEREALRVRSLAGAGRTGEAHRAAAAFAAQFPHSILLQAPQPLDDDGQKALE